MRVQLLVLVLAGCDDIPYEEYWPDEAAWPVLTGVYPEVSPSLLGGDEVELRGHRLASTQTVVFGGRNAEILEVTDRSVRVRVPPWVAGGGLVDVAVATDDGQATLEGWFRYEAPAGDYTADEAVSVAVARVDCPIEGWGVGAHGLRGAILWCGAELGYADGIAWAGVGNQSGFAADLLGISELSHTPPEGEVRIWGPGDRRPPGLPLVGGPQAMDDAITLTARRDLTYDIATTEVRQAAVEAWYSWEYAIESFTGPLASFEAEETCLLTEPMAILEVDGNRMVVDGEPPPEADRVRIGYGWHESYDDGTIYDERGWTGTGFATVEGDEVVVGPAGMVLGYDAWTGYYFPEGPGGAAGLSDLVPDVAYDLTWWRLDEATPLGSTGGGRVLDLEEPARLLDGRRVLHRDEPLVVRWAPLDDDNDPAFVVVDLRIYDTSVDDPNYLTEVARLTARAAPSDGELVVPTSAMRKLPVVDNRLDRNQDQMGYWGELTVTLHQLRKVPGPDEGDLVVDWMHVIQAPVRLD